MYSLIATLCFAHQPAAEVEAISALTTTAKMQATTPNALSSLLEYTLPNTPVSNQYRLDGAAGWSALPPPSQTGIHPRDDNNINNTTNSTDGGNSLTMYVDCTAGNDGSTDPYSPVTPLRTITRALALVAAGGLRQQLGRGTAAIKVTVSIAAGLCMVGTSPLQINAAHSGLVLVGSGPRTVISGGRPVRGWASAAWPPPSMVSPTYPVGSSSGAAISIGNHGREALEQSDSREAAAESARPATVFAANVADWPVEIKSLRDGTTVVKRSRWPKQHGEAGNTAPNFLFTPPWSNPGPMNNSQHIAHLGIDPHRMPAGANLSQLVGAYAHVLGCVERDVNSQKTKILAMNTTNLDQPSATVLFRNTFQVGCRLPR